MVNLQTVKTILFTIGPFLVPRLISYYRSVRVQSQTSPLPIRPVPDHVRNALNILFFASLLAFLTSLPFFTPENIFSLTASRLQTPNDVLFNRLANMRSAKGSLNATDELLRARLASLDGRLLYLTYGPSTTAYCNFCNSDDPQSYLYYALPEIVLPHLLNLIVLGLATSRSIAGSEGARWRTQAAIAGVVMALANCYLIGTYDHKTNARVIRPQDLDNFYWRALTLRSLAITVLDAAFASLLWATSTNRIFPMPPSTAERLEGVTRNLESTRGKLTAVGIVRNVIVRDGGMRRKSEAYWRNEGEVMGEVMSEREVVEGVRNALTDRIQLARVEEEAGKYAENLFSGGFATG
ncbi:hypothetical protein MMC25_005361 [Agyrium rufum]|nr:hypothetical protein [Agyrium rufum]